MINEKIMKKIENTVSQYQLQFVWPYSLVTIERVELKRSINEHAYLKLTGILKEYQVQDCLSRASYEDTLGLFQIGDKDDQPLKPLFKGRIKNIKIENIQEVYYVTVEGISDTYMMDIVVRYESFQNIKEKYTEVVEKVIKKYNHFNFIDNIADKAEIGEPRIQYAETDWQFLKRMVSYLGGVLVADITDARPRFWFGLPQGTKEISINEGNYIIRKNLHTYRDSVNNYKADIAEADLVECEIESHIYLDIGDKVKFHGRTMFVWASTATLKNGLLLYHYKLMGANGIRQNPVPNSKIQGVSIPGTIIDVAENMVKVHLEFDMNQNRAEAYWFPYSVDGNSAMYAMPQLGFNVALYFPNTTEKDAAVTHSLPSGIPDKITYFDGDKKKEFGLMNPGNKHFSTIHGKLMYLHQDSINFISQKPNLGDIPRNNSLKLLKRPCQIYSINMDVQHGITLWSDFDISIKAEGDIMLDKCKEITMNAANSILLSCRGDVIELEKQLNILGQSVTMKGQD